jgi:hypothetical protein
MCKFDQIVLILIKILFLEFIFNKYIQKPNNIILFYLLRLIFFCIFQLNFKKIWFIKKYQKTENKIN